MRKVSVPRSLPTIPIIFVIVVSVTYFSSKGIGINGKNAAKRLSDAVTAISTFVSKLTSGLPLSAISFGKKEIFLLVFCLGMLLFADCI